ncbi:MAG TPA: hypothetical protein VK858_20590 [Longimicrobiales bacterium]|nr:hypothetical protein [Longimicrobiales bacterium]
MRPKIENPVQFLRDHGILFEINRQVLHPLGLELHFELNEEGRITGIDLLDNRAIPEPIFFPPEAFNEGRSKYEEYLAEHGRRNIQKRRQIGVVIQTGPNVPRQLHSDDLDG